MITNTSRGIRFLSAAVIALLLTAPVQAASDKTTNTLLGAGLGAAAGAVLSEGDPMLTLGGAAAGGVLGNVLTKDSHRRYSHKKHSNRKYSKHPNYRYAKHSHHNGRSKKHHRNKRYHH